MALGDSKKAGKPRDAEGVYDFPKAIHAKRLPQVAAFVNTARSHFFCYIM
jgi:hypothetical protein